MRKTDSITKLFEIASLCGPVAALCSHLVSFLHLFVAELCLWLCSFIFTSTARCISAVLFIISSSFHCCVVSLCVFCSRFFVTLSAITLCLSVFFWSIWCLLCLSGNFVFFIPLFLFIAAPLSFWDFLSLWALWPVCRRPVDHPFQTYSVYKTVCLTALFSYNYNSS